MIKGEYKTILYQVFDVLGFFDSEKETALEGFKKKFAGELFKELEGVLSAEERRWIAEVSEKKEYDKNDPVVGKIQQSVNLAYPGEEFYKKSKAVFGRVLAGYIDFMSKRVSSDKLDKLKKILEDFINK